MPRYSATGVNNEIEPGDASEIRKGFDAYNRPTIDPKFTKEAILKPGDLTKSDTETNIIVELDANPKFDVVDLLMSRFAWEACQLDRGFGFVGDKKNKRIEAKLTTEEKRKIEDVLEKYRVYVQNNISITRVSYRMRPYVLGSYESAASSSSSLEGEKILNELNDITFQHPVFSKIPTKVVVGSQGIERTIVDEDSVRGYFYSEADADPNEMQGFMDEQVLEPQVSAQVVIDKMKAAFSDQQENLSKKERKEARKFLGLDDMRSKSDGRVDAAERILAGQDEMMKVLAQLGVQQDGSQENPELAHIRDTLVEVKRMNQNMASEINSLREAQIRNDGLDSVSWWDLPKWFRLKFAQGFWKGALFCATLPITIPIQLVSNIVVKPAWYTTKFLFEKLYLVWGFMMIFVVIGTTLHVFYTNEEQIIQMFNDISSYAQENLTFVSDYIFYPLRKAYENTATSEQLMAAWKRFLGGMFGNLWEMLTEKLSELKTYIASALWGTFQSYNPFAWRNPFW